MKTMSRHERATRSVRSLKALATLASAAIGVLCGTVTVSAAPILGSDLAIFTVLGSSTVTNFPTSSIVGNVDAWSSGGANAVTGFLSSPGVAVSDPQVTGGNVHAGTTTGTPNARSAQAQLTAAITNLGTLGPGTLLPADLAGLTLVPGVYTVPAANAADLCGRTLAETGAVTLDNNGLSGSCANVLPGSGGLSGGLDVTTTPEGITQVAFLPIGLVNGGTVPEPGTLMLLGFGLAGLGFSRRGNN